MLPLPMLTPASGKTVENSEAEEAEDDADVVADDADTDDADDDSLTPPTGDKKIASCDP